MNSLLTALHEFQNALLGLSDTPRAEAAAAAMDGGTQALPVWNQRNSGKARVVRHTLPFVRVVSSGAYTCASCSMRGLRRVKNEDSFMASPDIGLYAVADGIGGAPAGEIASSLAIQKVAAVIRRALQRCDGDESRVDPQSWLRHAVTEANAALFAAGDRESSWAGMGCTLDVALTREGGAYLAHVGDSRVYRLHSGKLEQLTTDHTLAHKLTEMQILKPEQAEANFKHVLEQGLGLHSPLKPELSFVELEPGDRLLLCTDGLYGAVPHAELQELVKAPLLIAPRALMDAAARHENADDITIVLIERNRPEDQPIN